MPKATSAELKSWRFEPSRYLVFSPEPSKEEPDKQSRQRGDFDPENPLKAIDTSWKFKIVGIGSSKWDSIDDGMFTILCVSVDANENGKAKKHPNKRENVKK